jgi:hypothetical protein
MVMKRTVLLLAAACSGSAQMISVGVKGGAVLSDTLSQQSLFTSATSGTWTGGPTVELRLPYRLSVEIDALYHGSRQTTTYPSAFPINATGDSVPAIFSSQVRTKSWEFPVLLKYRFLNGPVRPFVSAGFSVTQEWNHGFGYPTCLGTPAACSLLSRRGSIFDSTNNRKGPTAGAGIEFKRRIVTISPEVRYTHLDQPRGNKVAALVGFTFGK